MKLVPSDDPVLRSKCDRVTDAKAQVAPRLVDMLKLMRKKKGIGLAAPQVGIPLRFFVAKLKCAKVFVNPHVVERSRLTETAVEGCLSFPGKRVAVTRPMSIVATWSDLNGDRREKRLTGLEARVFLHETDHLDGRVICS